MRFLVRTPMNMHSIAWWPGLTLLVIATAVDIHSRRIPNWLVLPFLAVGVIANTASYGMKALGQSMGGIALAAASRAYSLAPRDGHGGFEAVRRGGRVDRSGAARSRTGCNWTSGRRAGADLGGLPQIARRIARRRGGSRLGVLDQGCTSASKLGSR